MAKFQAYVSGRKNEENKNKTDNAALSPYYDITPYS
jgi:hypothetical protein